MHLRYYYWRVPLPSHQSLRVPSCIPLRMAKLGLNLTIQLIVEALAPIWYMAKAGLSDDFSLSSCLDLHGLYRKAENGKFNRYLQAPQSVCIVSSFVTLWDLTWSPIISKDYAEKKKKKGGLGGDSSLPCQHLRRFSSYASVSHDEAIVG